jgi:Fe-S-cluster containining protein
LTSNTRPRKAAIDLDDPDLPAGNFSDWLRDTRAAHATGQGVDVPCGDCTACCRSSYFIHVGPDEDEALARIPAELLFAAPGMPSGNMVMGYGERGHCPMLVDDVCSIYPDRPRSCRQYDCRVFAAAGIAENVDDRPLITERARSWKFSLSSDRDQIEKAAVEAATKFVREHPEHFPGGGPGNASQLAMVAIAAYEVLQNHCALDRETGPFPSDSDVAREIVDAHRKFETDRREHRG